MTSNDEAGLLKPARIDEATGYRLYSAAQIPVLQLTCADPLPSKAGRGFGNGLARITSFDSLLQADAGRRAGDEGYTERAYERGFPCEAKISRIA
jgi:hypothetical protein